VDVRIIAATNHDLEHLVRDGDFRQDLYYRLAVFPITLPPLRERLDDVPLLVEALVEELAATMGKHIDAVSRNSLDALTRYRWPGNIRELRNTIERALILAPGPVLQIDPPGGPVQHSAPAPLAPRGLDRDRLIEVLRDTGWRVRGPRGAAEVLGLKPTTLETRMARWGIHRPGKTRT
jgi:transcriptional regulator with GAF, ATPase, and Fis domain